MHWPYAALDILEQSIWLITRPVSRRHNWTPSVDKDRRKWVIVAGTSVGWHGGVLRGTIGLLSRAGRTSHFSVRKYDCQYSTGGLTLKAFRPTRQLLANIVHTLYEIRVCLLLMQVTDFYINFIVCCEHGYISSRERPQSALSPPCAVWQPCFTAVSVRDDDPGGALLRQAP